MKKSRKKRKPLTLGSIKMDAGLLGVRFVYPGDGQSYYWFSQWARGVWAKKDMASGQIFPLFVSDLRECLKWELAP